MMYFGQPISLANGQDTSAAPTLDSMSAIAGYPVPAQQQAAQPFVYGAGGAHLSPDQLALRQKAALSASQADYSPIQSPWQGLARVAGNIMGAIDEKALDKKETAQNASDAATVSSLLATPTPGAAGAAPTGASPVAAALMSDNPQVAAAAKMVWEQQHPKAPEPGEFQKSLMQAGVVPGSADWTRQNQAYANHFTDPQITTSLPGGGIYVGPQSGFQAALGGQGAPAAPTAPVGPLTPIPEGDGAGNGSGGFQ